MCHPHVKSLRKTYLKWVYVKKGIYQTSGKKKCVIPCIPGIARHGCWSLLFQRQCSRIHRQYNRHQVVASLSRTNTDHLGSTCLYTIESIKSPAIRPRYLRSLLAPTIGYEALVFRLFRTAGDPGKWGFRVGSGRAYCSLEFEYYHTIATVTVSHVAFRKRPTKKSKCIRGTKKCQH